MAESQQKTVLLTGASGFIGRRIASLLTGRGYRVRLLSRNRQGVEGVQEMVQGDLTSPEDCRRAMAGVAQVIHAAGEKRDPALFAAVNVGGTQNLIDAARGAGVARFVYLSSIGALGAHPLLSRVVTEADSCRPRNGYERSKREAEERLEKAAAEGLGVSILRPSNVFGDQDGGRNLLTLIRAVRGRRFAYLGGREAQCNYVYVEDVARAALLLLEHPQAQGVYHLSDDCTIGPFVGHIARGLGVERPRFALPRGVAGVVRSLLLAGEPWAGGTALWSRLVGLNNQVCFPAGRLERELGWRCEVGWAKGLERLLGWYRSEGLL